MLFFFNATPGSATDGTATEDMGWEVHPKGSVVSFTGPHRPHEHPQTLRFQTHAPTPMDITCGWTFRLLFGHSNKEQGLWSQANLSLNPNLATSV